MKKNEHVVSELMSEINIPMLKESIQNLRQEMLQEMGDDAESDDIVIVAIIDNLLELLNNVKDVKNIELHRAISIVAHFQMFQDIVYSYEDMEDMDDDFLDLNGEEFDEDDEEEENVVVKPKLEKKPAKKKTK
jgi:hypothetical protein